jgi:hypothetical protein
MPFTISDLTPDARPWRVDWFGEVAYQCEKRIFPTNKAIFLRSMDYAKADQSGKNFPKTILQVFDYMSANLLLFAPKINER